MLRRRGFAHRLVAALLALWFAVVASEGARVHACAMHGGSDAAATTSSSGSAHGGHGAMHGAHDARAAAASDGDAPTQGERTHHCTCPDTSCGSAIVALATPRMATHFGIAIADIRAVFSPEHGRRLVAVPYLTPFANGPPAGALA